MLFVERKHSGAIAGKPHERPEATRRALCHLLGLLNNPQMQRVREQNHEVSQFVSNPNFMRQTMEMIRNPTTIQEIARNHDRALINLESLPSGCNVRQRSYRDFQEPMLNVAHEQFGDNPLNTNSSSSSTANTSQSVTNENCTMDTSNRFLKIISEDVFRIEHCIPFMATTLDDKLTFLEVSIQSRGFPICSLYRSLLGLDNKIMSSNYCNANVSSFMLGKLQYCEDVQNLIEKCKSSNSDAPQICHYLSKKFINSTDRNIVVRNIVNRNIVDRNMVDYNIVDCNIVDGNIVDRTFELHTP
ncbi:hypothetical protein GJ496_006179 [Pomphorhynchus laevis]|nr:hypothetical protein GJ496_006179 [Pomphorhynchus laevis]